MTIIFVLFVWFGDNPVPTLAYADSEACWAEAKIAEREGYPAECRAARFETQVGPVRVSPRPLPKLMEE